MILAIRKLIKLLLCMFVSFAWHGSFASIDDYQYKNDRDTITKLRWDNLQGDADWLSGPQPEKRKQAYWLNLPAGESISILQPADSWLRLVNHKSSQPLINSLIVERSIDGQLFINQPLESASSNNISLRNNLLNSSFKTSVIRLQNTSNKPVDFSLYRSRIFYHSPDIIYNEAISLPLEKIDLQISAGIGIQGYYQLPKLKPEKFMITGPRRLQFKLRQPLAKKSISESEMHFSIKVDDAEDQTYEVMFREDYHHSYRINGRRVIMSDDENIYVNIPEGEHRLTLHSSDELYFQLYALGQLYWTQQNLPDSIQWLNKETENLTHDINFTSKSLSYSNIEYRLLKLARNNSQNDSALLALAELDKILTNKKYLTSKWTERQYLNKLQNQIKQRYTRFQPVYPDYSSQFNNTDPDSLIQQRWFRYLRDHLQFKQGQKPFYLTEKFFKYRLKKISEQGFNWLNKNKLSYPMQALDVDSEIRLLVYSVNSRIKEQTIWVQIGDLKPQKLIIRNTNFADKFKIKSVAEYIINNKGCCESMLGGLATDKGSAPLIKVASVELKLPAGANRIKVWSRDASNLWVAAQQRRGINYQLSESQYLSVLNQGQTFEQFVRALSGDSNLSPNGASNSSKSFENHWLSFIETLMTTYNNRIENIEPIIFLDEHISNIEEQKKLQLSISKALKAEQSEQWIIALEHWSTIMASTNNDLKKMALNHMVFNLKRSGNPALAKKLQLAIIFSSTSIESMTKFIESQLDNLLNDYQQQGNEDARVSLLMAYFVHRPTQNNLQRLAKILLEEDRPLHALQLFLLLPESQQPKSGILLSSLQSGWLTVFDKQLTLANFPKNIMHKWTGLRALYQGGVNAAKLSFIEASQQGDEEVKEWLSILNNSQSLQNQIISNLNSNSQLNLKQWQALQGKSNNQNYRKWKPDHSLIINHAGQVTLNNPETQRSLMHYISRPQQPLELRIAGPAKLRLQVRPLHTLANKNIEALNSRFYIDNGNNKHVFFINHNMPDKNWQFQSYLESGIHKNKHPGQRHNQDLNLGNGIHYIKIVSDEELLIRTYRETSSVPVNVLPELSAENMAFILNTNNKFNTPLFNLDVLLKPMQVNSITSYQLPALEQLQNITLKVESAKNAKIVDQNNIAEAEKIYTDSGQLPSLSGTMSRLRRFSRWQLLDSIEQSDGFWVRRYDGWQAESPQSRLFKSLMTQRQLADEVLRNGSSHVVSVFNTQADQLTINLKAVKPFFIRSKPLMISYQVDNKNAQIISVGTSLKSLKISLSRGQHSIKVNVLQADSHHRLWLSIEEQNGQSATPEKSRRYQLASANQPLVYRLQGPVWLRIDKYLNSETESQYQYFPDGVHRLSLKPNSPEQTAYFRVFKRVMNQAKIQSQFINWDNKPDLNTKETLADTIQLDKTVTGDARLIDGWNLGRQQKGTTSLLLTRVDQNLIIDELAVSTDQYLESELAYRKYSPLSQQWFYIAGLGRLRNEGNPTLGIKSRLRGNFDFTPIDWTIDGRAYTQKLESGTESSLLLQMRLSQTRWIGRDFYHLPKMDVFLRWLSAENDTGNTNIDRDVYSDYKKDHPSGLRLSERLIYRLYQDMELYVGVALTTNTNWLDLDQYTSRVGARVQWGDVRWDINARNLQFQADDDRAQATSRSVIQARLLLEKWLYPRYRFELATAIDHDVDSKDNTLRLQFSVHQSEGRGYQDYSPSETLFRHVRQTNLDSELKNEIN